MIKLIHIPVLIALALMMLCTGASALSILTPEDKSYFDKPFMYVVGKIDNPNATHLSVTVNDLRSPLMDIKKPEYVLQFKDYFILDLELDEGENLIGVTLYKDGKSIEEKRMLVNKMKKGESLPKGKTLFHFHVASKEKQCDSCHTITKETCLDCHKGIIARKFVHGPAGSGDCDTCHDPVEKNGIKHLVRSNKAELCHGCHEALNPQKMEFLHGPFAGGECEQCHNVHSADYPHQLLRDVNDLCKTCHEEFKKPTTHVVVKHPISDKKDPSRPGMPMQCISCHNPHGEKSKVFFVKGVTQRMDLCALCHQK